jgi:hypothetical protein
MEATSDSGRVFLSRCPYCHDGVDFTRCAWVACAACLARHHAPCWAEHIGCSACGDRRPLQAVEKERRSPRRVAAWPFVLAGLLPFTPVAVTWYWTRPTQSSSVERTPAEPAALSALSALDDMVRSGLLNDAGRARARQRFEIGSLEPSVILEVERLARLVVDQRLDADDYAAARDRLLLGEGPPRTACTAGRRVEAQDLLADFAKPR